METGIVIYVFRKTIQIIFDFVSNNVDENVFPAFIERCS